MTCHCGDTVTASYVMPGPLGPCPGHGLILTSQVTLDCQGFGLTGLGNGSEQYGIYLDGDTGAEVTGVTVRRCEVSGFLRGIRLRAAEQSSIVANYAHDNGDVATHVGYGIDVAVASRGNLFLANTIEGNADEGIHFGSDTGPNQFLDNVLFDNYREQIYVLSSDGNTLSGNTTYGTGSNSLYLKDSNGNYLAGNTFRDRSAKVIGDSSRNLFVDNTFANAVLQFTVYKATPDRIPTNNGVSGGSMTSAGACLRFTDTVGNVVSDVALTGCGTEVLSESTATEPSINTIVSTALNPSKVSTDGASTLSVGWWTRVHVQDAAGQPLSGARVRVLDVAGSVAFDLLTDAAGNVSPQLLLEYVRTGGASAAKTPHTLTTSKSGYVAGTQVVRATQDLDVTVVLSLDQAPGSFSDDFTRPDATVIGNGWQQAQGQFVVSGGELRNAAVIATDLAVQPALRGRTQSAEADFASVDNNAKPRFGIVLRYQDPRNYYLLYRLTGGTSVLRISRIVNGAERILASVPIANPTPNSFFHLSGRAWGTLLILELGGVPKLSVTDPTFASGSVGVLMGSSSTKAQRIDNFSAAVQ